MGIDRTAYKPVFRQLADILRAGIVGGDIPPGEYLPVEGDLCHTYDVGLSTVRKALDILRVEGLIETQRGIGTQVRQWGERRVENVPRGGKVHFRLATAAERRTLRLPEGSFVAVLTTPDGEERVFRAPEVEFLFGDDED